jgi:cation diffusion facilitator family transporter
MPLDFFTGEKTIGDRPMDIAPRSSADRSALAFAMNVSLAVGLLMFAMKTTAYWITGSAAILSDAAESVVHVAAVVFAAYSLRRSSRPPDEHYLYGHAKISFFSAGFEGAMIMIAAVYIIWESLHKWISGLQLENLGTGTWLTAAAAAVNGVLGAYLLWIGRKKRSVILEANGKHVLTDCWTSVGALIGLGLVMVTGWLPFDPICGILIACNILWSGAGLIRASFGGLMDVADPKTHLELREILARETATRGLAYHQLRHRNVGTAHWIEFHLLFPRGTSLVDAHRTATEIEHMIESALDHHAHVTTHLESMQDHDKLHVHGDPLIS